MLHQQFDLDTLYHILSQFSDDIIRDCSKIIYKLLISFSELTLNDSVKFQDKRTFASVRVLLNLFETLHVSSSSAKSELPISLIIQSVKHVLYCSKDHCNLPDRHIQCNVLSIVSLILKNLLRQNSKKTLEELTEFYDYIFVTIHASSMTSKNCKSDCLIFKLKIMNLMYQAVTNIAVAVSPNVIKFYNTLQTVNNSKECKLFADLVLKNDDCVAMQTLIYLIPDYINYCKNDEVLKVIWQHISNFMTHSAITHSKVLIILCNFFSTYFDKSILKDKMDFLWLLFEDINYWKLIQCALVERDPIKRKQALYLFKKTINVLNSTRKNIECNKGEISFYWCFDCKDELYKIYSEVIIALEFLEEQQAHIIKPIFNLVEALVRKIIECDKVNFFWILLMYQKALMHENIQIVKWSLNNLLKLPENFFSHEYIVKETAQLLVVSLNRMGLYYNEGLAISNELSLFFNNITHLSSSRIFFSLFIKQLCSQIWSAEALFFVTHSLSNIGRFPYWGKEEILEIGMFVSKAFKTHNKIIRAGIQCELLKAILDLTDEKDVTLQNFILLISSFSMRHVIKVGSQIWDNLINWLRNSYSKQEAMNILESYKRQELDKEFNGKCVSLSLMLFYYTYDLSERNSFAINCFQDMILSYKEIYKRLYCDTSLYNEYLSVICYIYKASLDNSIAEFIKPSLPFIKEILLYIKTELQKISSLGDFNACQLYINTFEITTKTLVLMQIDSEEVRHSFTQILKDLETFSGTHSDFTSIGMYWRVKLLGVILRLQPFELNSSFFDSHYVNAVNKPLKKDYQCPEKTRDLQSLWGKMNSEFLEEKWKILEYLIDKKLILHGSMKSETAFWVGVRDLAKLCDEALNTGGYGVLCPVMSILKLLLPILESDLDRELIDLVWKIISERRKTEDFKLFIKQFVEMIFQDAFILKSELAREILIEYADVIYVDSSLAVVNIFIKHIQKLNLLENSVHLFCHIIGKGLIFGPVQKRNEKLTTLVCSHIEFYKICHVQEISDYNTSNQIRARAVQNVLKLDKNSSTDQTVAKNLIKTLLKMENEINKNRLRYFGNSYVHRVKHRLMQALLLLEPMLDSNEKLAKELLDWLLNSLANENPQPSVRYLQEWLLVRILLRHSELFSQFHISKHCSGITENKKKGVCSFISVTFHLCKLLPLNVMETRIDSEISTILSLCFHQHFEIRLFAQVVFEELYRFAESKKLGHLTKDYENVYLILRENFERGLKGNLKKNMAKLKEDFYFTTFNPLEHYSLETIYTDLPKLANVESDEWISTKIFEFCGVDANKVGISLKNPGPSLIDLINTEWPLKKLNLHDLTELDEYTSKDVLENYQKKIIPEKSLIPDWKEGNTAQDNRKNDGLIVVASLIDRVPNLGGLVRTCEVFGVSEYIINSLKYIEDKQFTSLSVTAEKWITIKEVKVQNLLDYVIEMKQKEYTVIGAEQTLYSQPLNSVKFPRKTLLLLGNEKEGIPPNLLPLLDICIEIPQLGIIRSLNVHVTGALFIWEYAKQNYFS